MSRSGGQTSSKIETQPEEKERETSSKQPDGYGDQQKGTLCDHHAAVAARKPDAKDEKSNRSGLSEGPVTQSDYGSFDAVKVCQSCQHLYVGASEVVLSPCRLETDPPSPSPASLVSHKDISTHRPWRARRYEGLCDCGASVSGGVCVCPRRAASETLHGLLPRSSPWLRRAKVAALFLAGLLPWAFLVAYCVLKNK